MSQEPHEPLPGPGRVLEMASGYEPALILEAAVRLGMFDALAEGASTVPELAARVGASVRGARAILSALVGVDLLIKRGDAYALTPESAAYLVTTSPEYQGYMCKHVSRHLLPRWLRLTDVVRTGRPDKGVNEQAGGAEFFREFVEDIFPMSYDAARALAEELRVREAAEPLSVLDLAAGSGVWGIALAEASPKVSVTAVDWPGVLPVTQRIAKQHGVLDHLSLMTVDHPKGTEVFVDERFAVPQPVLKLYATSEPKPFARANDEHGNNVSDVVNARDGRYLDSFARGQYQGVTGDHWVELQLGPDAPADQPLVLLGFGWVHPTDSSINLAMAEGQHDAPRGLTIEVPDANGGWKTARTGVGFPAGKNKTIVLDLNGLWPAGAERKLRLRTNLEVYWDWLAWAVRLDDSLLETHQLQPSEAQLAYHGFSKITEADAQSPELPDYQTIVGTEPRWLDLAGLYTRYGDVRELLEKVDDRYVIMNAGDEIRLRFPAGPRPTAGRVRDFVVVADGWEKDGDFNTAFSRTVLPLPRHDWPAYDRVWDRLEDDPAYQRHPEDWLNYHTRYVDPNDYRAALRHRN